MERFPWFKSREVFSPHAYLFSFPEQRKDGRKRKEEKKRGEWKSGVGWGEGGGNSAHYFSETDKR